VGEHDKAAWTQSSTPSGFVFPVRSDVLFVAVFLADVTGMVIVDREDYTSMEASSLPHIAFVKVPLNIGGHRH